jgi:hypothetical protein
MMPTSESESPPTINFVPFTLSRRAWSSIAIWEIEHRMPNHVPHESLSCHQEASHIQLESSHAKRDRRSYTQNIDKLACDIGPRPSLSKYQLCFCSFIPIAFSDMSIGPCARSLAGSRLPFRCHELHDHYCVCQFVPTQLCDCFTKMQPNSDPPFVCSIRDTYPNWTH